MEEIKFIKKTREELNKELDSVFFHLRDMIIEIMKEFVDDERFNNARIADMEKERYFGIEALGRRVNLFAKIDEFENGLAGAVMFGDEHPVFCYSPNSFYDSGEYALFLMELEIKSYIRHWVEGTEDTGSDWEES